LHINFDSVVWACEDDVNVTVPYNITSGSFTSCDLELVADGSAYASLNDVTPEPNMLLFPMPKEVIPGVYNLNIKFAETSCGLDAISLPMHVYYSKSILVQRWGDVLAVTNKDYNGGYDFVAFQWYKNGAPIEGANSSILYDPDGLDINAEYSVLLTRRDDNVTIKTCVAELHDLNSSDTDVIVFKVDNTVEVDLTDTQLCLRDCLFLLDELGFVSSDWEVDAGEGEVWITCYQEDMTYITLLSDAYLGRLQMFWTPGPTQEDIDKLKELMKKHWGKYFPVI
jgi:hypothetical protein